MCAKYRSSNFKTVPWAQKVNFCQKNTKKVKEKNTFSPLRPKKKIVCFWFGGFEKLGRYVGFFFFFLISNFQAKDICKQNLYMVNKK